MWREAQARAVATGAAAASTAGAETASLLAGPCPGSLALQLCHTPDYRLGHPSDTKLGALAPARYQGPALQPTCTPGTSAQAAQPTRVAARAPTHLHAGGAEGQQAQERQEGLAHGWGCRAGGLKLGKEENGSCESMQHRRFPPRRHRSIHTSIIWPADPSSSPQTTAALSLIT